jgi:CRISPR-associated protein Cmr6
MEANEMERPRNVRAQRDNSKDQEKPEGWPTPFPLAMDTAQIVANYGDRSRNLGLWLDHFISWNDGSTRGRRPELQPANDIKRRECLPLKAVQDNQRNHLELKDWEPIMGYSKRWSEMLRAYVSTGFEVRNFSAQPIWRIIVGLGAESVLETSMRMHHIYGFPIIPGSAIKGLTRAYAELVLGKSPDDPEIVSIFGTPSGKTPLQAGNVIFFDAIPVNSPHFKLDVINPHYGEYYRGGDVPPADYLRPVPVYFLTVEKDSIFSFAVAAPSTHAHLANMTEKCLKKALIELGIGAKTTAGYGQMEHD